MNISQNSKMIRFAMRIIKYIPWLEPYFYKFARKRSKRSKGELLVERVLTDLNIPFEQEYLIKFPYIVKKKPFVFIDFRLPKHNCFIEYNGKQHYEYVPYFHKSEDDFERQKFRDFIVRDYCEQRGIKLIEIPYWMKDHEVEELLKTELND